MGSIDPIRAGMDTTSVSTAHPDVRAARDELARRNLAALAADPVFLARQEVPVVSGEAFQDELLDALGLRGESRPSNRARHVMRDVRRLGGQLVHGTTTGYDRHKCRCDLCRDANHRYRQAKGITK